MNSKVQKNIQDSNEYLKTNSPSLEVIELLQSNMTDAATVRLIEIVSELDQYYGTSLTDTICTIDDFINHYHTSELIKKDIKERIEYFERRDSNYDVSRLISYIKEECEPMDLESEQLNSDLFSMRMIKKFISDMAVVFALNQPVHDRKREEILKKCMQS